MSLLKDISLENIIKFPESATAKDMIDEVELIEFVIKRVKESEEDYEKFLNLTKKWKEETFVTSSYSEIISNPSYLEVVRMGKKVLPYILQDLKSEPAFWFSALEELTGCNPIEPSHRGIIKLMKKDWLKWGEEHGYV